MAKNNNNVEILISNCSVWWTSNTKKNNNENSGRLCPTIWNYMIVPVSRTMFCFHCPSSPIWNDAIYSCFLVLSTCGSVEKNAVKYWFRLTVQLSFRIDDSWKLSKVFVQTNIALKLLLSLEYRFITKLSKKKLNTY